MPLGLLAVASNLDPERYDVRIIDGRLQEDPLQAVLDECSNALCLGISVLTGLPIRDALRISRAVKAKYPSLPIVWGGWHPSLFPLDTLQEPSVDVTVQAQGEITFRELLERFAERSSLDGLPGIAWRKNGEAVQNAPRPTMDMNQLAPANYDLISVERYYRLKGNKQIDYISSTGCFFRCAFCADPFVFKRQWTGIEPLRIAEELTGLWKHHRFNEVAFQDETFFTYRPRVTAMAEEFLRRNTRFTWTATMRADQGERMSDEEWELCARSGMRWLLIGVESGSQEMLNWMKKDITLEQVFHSAERCARYGVKAVFPVIVGFPGESDASVQASMDVAKKLRAMHPSFDTHFFYFKPYPGSAITQQAVEQGYQLPKTLEEWADFDFVDGSSGPWVGAEKYRTIERFKFYQRFAWGHQSGLRKPLQWLARQRCNRNFYGLPVEKRIVELLKSPAGSLPMA